MKYYPGLPQPYTYAGVVGITVPTIALLRTVDKTTASSAQTLGYWTVGDRGDGVYELDAGDHTSPDDGGAVIVANDGGRWKLVSNGILNIKQYGAMGTGASDDTTYIRNAFANANFHTIYFPSGTYMTTGVINLTHTTTLFGDTSITSTIYMNHTGTGLSIKNINTYGLFIMNMQIAGNNVGIGIEIDSSTEVSSHLKLSNLRIASVAYGLYSDPIVNFSMFDSCLDNVDFIQCTAVGWTLGGSQNSAIGCSFRICGYGILLTQSSGGAAGSVLNCCTFIQNTYDIVVNSTYIRPLVFHGCWFEQTASLSVGKLTGGSEVYFVDLCFDKCLFQPAATALGNGVIDNFNYKGLVAFQHIMVYQNLYASAGLPSETSGDSNCIINRISCATINGAGTVTALKDYTTNDKVNFYRLYQNRQYANDAAAGVAGLTTGDVYYNTTVGAMSMKN